MDQVERFRGKRSLATHRGHKQGLFRSFGPRRQRPAALPLVLVSQLQRNHNTTRNESRVGVVFCPILSVTSDSTQVSFSWLDSKLSCECVVLKVTNRKVNRGQQTATYRLQLRYRYSVVLIIMSVFTYWLVSNALFIIISQGCKYNIPKKTH